MRGIEVIGIFFVFLVVFSGGVYAATDIFVKVSDVDDSPISGASVSVSRVGVSNSEEDLGETGEDGVTDEAYTLSGGTHDVVVSASASEYDSGTLIFSNIVVSSVVNTDQVLEIHLADSGTGGSGEMYVVDEKIVTSNPGFGGESSCGSDDWEETYLFTDKDDDGPFTVRHCVLRGTFASGNSYVVNSYLEAWDGVAKCRAGGTDVAFFVDENGDSIFLCVERGVVSNENEEMILRDARIGVSCASGFEEGEKFSVEGEAIVHCKSVRNPPAPEPTVGGECEIIDAGWYDPDINSISGAVRGFEGGVDGDEVVVWMNVRPGCFGKTFSVDICESNVAGTDCFVSQDLELVSLEAPYSDHPTEGSVAFVFWKPVWKERAAPGISKEAPIEYIFTVEVGDEGIFFGPSNVLVVQKPDLSCLSDSDCFSSRPLCSVRNGAGTCVSCLGNSDCSSGEVCSAGECVEQGECVVSNARWRGESGNTLSSGSQVTAWIFDGEHKDGDTVQLFVDASDCSESDIEFRVMEADFLVDDVVDLLSSRGVVGSLEWQLPWNDPFGFSGEGSRLEYYFFPIVSGVELSDERSSIIKVVAPDEHDCSVDSEDVDCSSGEICSEGGECVGGCREDNDCGGSFICESEVCVECRASRDCDEGFICNSAGTCVEGTESECRVNSDCGSDEICTENGCLNPNCMDSDTEAEFAGNVDGSEREGGHVVFQGETHKDVCASEISVNERFCVEAGETGSIRSSVVQCGQGFECKQNAQGEGECVEKEGGSSGNFLLDIIEFVGDLISSLF